MTFQVRRVVTGHDANGKAIVTIDDVLPARSMRAGVTASVAWTSEGFPVDNNGDADEGKRQTGTTHANGTVFRIIEFAPGNAGRDHRTDSIDYLCILSGEIDMDIDGAEVHLKAGDVMVQRGTIHNWINRGREPCVIAFVLIAAHSAGGKALPAVG
jgi:mannose-6-phosphate isomerase-like protein (cupin superfamily)